MNEQYKWNTALIHEGGCTDNKVQVADIGIIRQVREGSKHSGEDGEQTEHKQPRGEAQPK